MPIATAVLLAISAGLATVSGVAQATSASSALHGRVLFTALPVPGATVTAAAGPRRETTTCNEAGEFTIALEPGTWTLRVEMRGFVPAARTVIVPYEGPPLDVTLTLLPFAEIVRAAPAAAAESSVTDAPEDRVDPLSDLPDIVTGSSINGAASPFAQPRAFGNNRPRTPSLYNGAATIGFGNSALNARPYSFGGVRGATPSYSDLQLGFAIGGPLRIPGLIKYGPQTFVSYQHGATHSADTRSALMPTAAEREGDFSGGPAALIDPSSGLRFAGDTIPGTRISPQARALLAYYPLPNASDINGANYQTTVVTAADDDRLQLALNSRTTRRDTFSTTLVFQRTA